MKKIRINKDNYVASPYIRDANILIEVSEEDYKKISVLPFDFAWKLKDNQFILEPLLIPECLRNRRKRECFNLIDGRGQLWYSQLTTEQSEELKTWYKAWLDVTETKVIPEKPIWLK